SITAIYALEYLRTSRRTISLENIVNQRAGQCVGASLIALAAREQTVEFVESRAGAHYQLIEQLSLVSKSAAPFDLHRKSFVKPTWDGSTLNSARDQHVRNFVAQDVFETVVGITWGTGGKEDYQVRLRNSKSGNPRWNRAGQIRTLQGEYDVY